MGGGVWAEMRLRLMLAMAAKPAPARGELGELGGRRTREPGGAPNTSEQRLPRTKWRKTSCTIRLFVRTCEKYEWVLIYCNEFFFLNRKLWNQCRWFTLKMKLQQVPLFKIARGTLAGNRKLETGNCDGRLRTLEVTHDF